MTISLKLAILIYILILLIVKIIMKNNFVFRMYSILCFNLLWTLLPIFYCVSRWDGIPTQIEKAIFKSYIEHFFLPLPPIQIKLAKVIQNIQYVLIIQ